MIVPNKVISYQNSIISKMLIILDHLNRVDGNKVIDLFLEHGSNYEGIEEFIYSLDVLFLLEVIDLDLDSGVVRYVKRNTM